MSDLIKRLISIIIIIVLTLIFFSFLKNTQDIDNFAYVVAVGLDKGSNNNLNITFQTWSPTNGESSGDSSESSGSSEGGNSSKVINTSIECSSINSGIQLLNGYIGSKQLNLSHCQSIIFSEELAYEGISRYIYTFINNSQLRHSSNIVIAKSSAEYYLNNSESAYEKLISKYYDLSPTSGKYTGYTNNISILNFFCNLNNNFQEPTAVLSAINIPKTVKDYNYDDNYLEDSTYKAGQSPITTDNPGMEDVGIAVFKNDQFIGELTAIETIAHLMTINNFESCELSILSPFDEDSTIDVALSKNGNTKINVDIVNGSPFITIDINLNADVLSMNKNENYLDNAVLSELESALNKYLENILYEYLYKTSIEYGSDISGFGKYAMPKFLTNEDWNNYHWAKNYKNSFFKVNISSQVVSSNLLLKT